MLLNVVEIEKYYGIIAKFHAAGVYQHLYTNGTLATEETLRALVNRSGLQRGCAPAAIGRKRF